MLGYFNGLIGGHTDGFYFVCGEYGVRQRNLERLMLLQFCLGKELCVSNMWFKRKEMSDILHWRN